MIRRRKCLWLFLALAVVFFYEWLLVCDVFRTPPDLSRSLAKDALEAAVDSVRQAIRLLLDDFEYDTRSNTTDTESWRTTDRQRTKIELLQASLDDFLFHDSPKVGGSHAFHTHRSSNPVGIDEDASFDVCASLAGTRTTMIGGDHIYRLHTLLLQHREHVEDQPFPCFGRKFCTHHHICLPSPPRWDDSPPKEKPRSVKPPSTQELIETESALVNYIVSDTLFAAPDETSWEYTMPYLDPMTGVRLSHSFWLAAARKANVVVLGRGPLSPPGSTYAGNWSFLHHAPEYIDKTRGAIESKDRTEMDASRTAPRPLEIVNIAVHLTISRFLPEVFQVLQAIRREVRPSKRKRLIWAGAWYRFPGRGTARMAFLRPHPRPLIRGTIPTSLHHSPPLPAEKLDLTSQLSALLDADATNKAELEDPWTLLYNIQVYVQNMVLRELLPRHGIVFLSLNTPWSDDIENQEHRFSHVTPADAEFERTEIDMWVETLARAINDLARRVTISSTHLLAVDH